MCILKNEPETISHYSSQKKQTPKRQQEMTVTVQVIIAGNYSKFECDVCCVMFHVNVVPCWFLKYNKCLMTYHILM